MVTALFGIIFTALFASLGWIFIQQEDQDKRISVLESRKDALMDYIKTRFDSVEGRLDRIEKKQDTSA